MVDNKLPDSESFLNIDVSNIICSSFKLAEDGRGCIIRLYETAGKDTHAELKIVVG